jgi:hypothetical protein
MFKLTRTSLTLIESKYAIKLVKTDLDRSPMPICASDNFHVSDYLLTVKGVRVTL